MDKQKEFKKICENWENWISEQTIPQLGGKIVDLVDLMAKVAYYYPSSLSKSTGGAAAEYYHSPKKLKDFLKSSFKETDVEKLYAKVQAYNLVKHKDPKMMFDIPSRGMISQVAGMDDEKLKKTVLDFWKSSS